MIFALSGIEYYFRKSFTVGQLFDGVEKKEDLQVRSLKLNLTVVVPHLWAAPRVLILVEQAAKRAMADTTCLCG